MSGPPFRSVWFDCDSTLSAIEGVDELARELAPELRAEITALTERAMDGEIPLADVYGLRLHRLAPARAQLARIGELYVQHALPDARLVVAALVALGKTVGIVSGGLRDAVVVLARHLGIAESHVEAVRLRFGPTGEYAGFDDQSPLARNGGKPQLLAARPAAERPLAFVGDGVTDLEAAAVVDRFIGFGGIARREAVESRAAFYVTGPRLAGVLPHLLSADEQRRIAADARFQEIAAPLQR